MPDLGTIGFASPLDADDTTYGDYFTDNTTGTGGSVAMNTTPSDLTSVTAVDMSGIAITSTTFAASGPDNIDLGVRIMDGANVLAAASAGGAYEDTTSNWNSGNDGTDVSWTDVSFTYVDTSATRTQWENATAEFQQTYNQDKGPDNVRLLIDQLTVGGTYSADEVLDAQPGTLTLTGGASALNVSMAATAGTLTLTGATADFATALPANPGTLTLTGATATTDLYLAASPGALTLTGADAVLKNTADFKLQHIYHGGRRWA